MSERTEEHSAQRGFRPLQPTAREKCRIKTRIPSPQASLQAHHRATPVDPTKQVANRTSAAAYPGIKERQPRSAPRVYSQWQGPVRRPSDARSLGQEIKRPSQARGGECRSRRRRRAVRRERTSARSSGITQVMRISSIPAMTHSSAARRKGQGVMSANSST